MTKDDILVICSEDVFSEYLVHLTLEIHCGPLFLKSLYYSENVRL